MHKTRKEAKVAGAKHYSTGLPCKNGHIDLRVTSCGTCLACAREKTARWAALNYEKHLQQKKSGRTRRADKIAAASIAWRKANKDKKAAQQAKRRAVLKQRTVPWADRYEIAVWYEVAEVLSRGGVRFHVDHIVPLKGKYVCGLHTQDNLQILPWHINLQKGARFKEKNI